MADKPDPLESYNKKRDFAKTKEPKGKRAQGAGDLFMVQKHDATRLHWDLRLEMDGVLKSWAVTRGPSLDPADKRLAVRTEDHPMSYATFEGTIPKDQYGGGTVMLWDWGRWRPDPRKDARESLAKGHLHFTLEGKRMKGEWLLIRMKPKPGEKRENWLLRKLDDAHAGPATDLVDRHLTSIKTGRTMQEIAEDGEAREIEGWDAPDPAVPRRKPGSRNKAKLDSGLRRNTGRPPAFSKPQLATLVDHVPSGSGWLHEMKYDGYRCLVATGGGAARVYTRSGLDWSDKFPEVCESASQLDAEALIDGEIVKLDAEGRTDFRGLKEAISKGGTGLSMFAFDLLEVGGRDLKRLPTIERKARLAALLGEGAPAHIHYAEHIVGEGEKLLAKMCEAGQEGIISKKAEAPYRGRRTKNWLKIKCTRRQEFIIVGWTKSDKKARPMRSLMLATQEQGELVYAGKVGTGFTMAKLAELREKLERIGRKTPPLDVSKSEARGAQWATPKLVAEIAFTEFTGEGLLRHPSFLGLREDKAPGDVGREAPQPVGKADDDAAKIRISNAERVIFPDAGVSKGALADYYRRIGAAMLPWAGGRPISLVRCPQGRAKKCFFQKHDSGSFGEHVKQVPIREKGGGTEDYLYVDDVAGLVACVQMGTIEFHGWGARAADVEKPDRLVFDLDPDEGLDFDEVRKAARDLKRHLADIGLVTFCLLTGGKGLHIVAPLKPRAEWPQVKDFARRFAMALAEAEPERFTATMSKAKRKGRIFIDYLRNQRGATAILPYSARARAGAPVAAPIGWGELKDAQGGDIYRVTDVETLLERASSRTLAGWGEAEQALPDV
ncbi:MAG: DNA ligase D [Sphingomonadaceae bacterium]